jgi:hypothetical protein
VGLLFGALIGWLAHPIAALPAGMASGLAVGVGIDSLLNRRINGPFYTEDDDQGEDDHAAR